MRGTLNCLRNRINYGSRTNKQYPISLTINKSTTRENVPWNVSNAVN